MNTRNIILATAAMSAAVMFAPAVSADPAFETAPVDQSQLPGQLLHHPLAIKWDPVGNNKSVSIVESEGVPGGQAISFRVKRKNSRKPWEIRMRAPFDANVVAGDQIDIYFWARAEQIPRGKDTGHISVVLGRNVEPYDTVIDQEIMPSADWKMYRVSGTAGVDFPSSEADMGFNFGAAKQTIELGPFYAIKAHQSED